MTTAAMDTFTVPESALLQRLPVARADLKKMRDQAVRGVDWERLANSRIYWSEQAVARLLTACAGGDGISEKTAALPATRVFVVARVRTPRVLHVVDSLDAYDPHRPVCCWLPLPKGYLFTRGMKVRVRDRAGVVGLFDYEGNPDAPEKGRRFPRKVGTW